jgi:hypothetical protein
MASPFGLVNLVLVQIIYNRIHSKADRRTIRKYPSILHNRECRQVGPFEFFHRIEIQVVVHIASYGFIVAMNL